MFCPSRLSLCVTLLQGCVVAELDERLHRPHLHPEDSVERAAASCFRGKRSCSFLHAAVSCAILSGFFCDVSRRYLFQSVDTASATINGQINPSKLAVCTTELHDALKFTDIGGSLGSHPNFPPFPLCRSKTTAATTSASPVIMQDVPNPAQAAEGYAAPEQGPKMWADWVTKDWTPTIDVPNTLVKTTSTGTM
jgi:hypothetical protein